VPTQADLLIQKLSSELGSLRKQVENMEDGMKPLVDISAQIAVIHHRLDEITKTKESWGQRGWMVLTIWFSALLSLSVAAAGILLTYSLGIKK